MASTDPVAVKVCEVVTVCVAVPSKLFEYVLELLLAELELLEELLELLLVSAVER